MKITILPEDIEKANAALRGPDSDSGRNCAIAQAVKRTFPTAGDVFVGALAVAVDRDEYDLGGTGRFIMDFPNHPVAPGTEIELTPVDHEAERNSVDQMYRVVITTEIFVSCENRQQARELAIKNLREGNFGDWEITYVGRSEGDDEVDVTDNTEDLP